jgi:hypothetical protein
MKNSRFLWKVKQQHTFCAKAVFPGGYQQLAIGGWA